MDNLDCNASWTPAAQTLKLAAEMTMVYPLPRFAPFKVGIDNSRKFSRSTQLEDVDRTTWWLSCTFLA